MSPCIRSRVNTSPITSWLASRARRAQASQMTMYRSTWRVSQSPRHRCVRCIMTSLATTVMSHENAPNIEFSYASLGVWNDGNSRNQTLTIGRLFQLCITNYSQQEKLEYSEYIFVTFTKFRNPQFYVSGKKPMLCQVPLPLGHDPPIEIRISISCIMSHTRQEQLCLHLALYIDILQISATGYGNIFGILKIQSTKERPYFLFCI